MAATTLIRHWPNAVGEFWPKRDLLLLDLTALPGIPEFFELGKQRGT
jgi:hypothetical protein